MEEGRGDEEWELKTEQKVKRRKNVAYFKYLKKKSTFSEIL